MSDLSRYVDEQMASDPEFAAEYNRLEPEYAAVQALIDARETEGMTLADLSRATGMRPQNIQRIEKGEANPTVRTLARLASGLGKRLVIRFV